MHLKFVTRWHGSQFQQTIYLYSRMFTEIKEYQPNGLIKKNNFSLTRQTLSS
jgi:hypothetical protein